MRLHITSSTIDKTVSGEVAWGDGAVVNLGTKNSKDFVDNLVRATNPKIGLLPPAVRWISNDKRIVVFERPPSYQRVAYFELERSQVASIPSDKSRYPLYEYNLPLPWTVYVMGFGFDYQPVSVRVFMRPEPLFDLDEPVYLLPLLNFYTNSKLCNPIFAKYEEHEPSIAAGIHSAYHTVWNSGFNFDLLDAIKCGIGQHAPFKPLIAKKLVTSGWAGSLRMFLAAWEEATLEDIIAAKYINPSVSDNNSSMDEIIPLRHAISAVHEELTLSMGSTNIAKNFITSLVNNFNTL